MASSGGGSKIFFLLILLALLGGAGAYNYQRNVKAEVAEQGPRAYQSYSDADLEALADAYRQEIEAFEQMVSSARQRKVQLKDGGRIRQGVQQFERVQQNSSRQRELQGELIDRQLKLADIEKEQALREPAGDPLAIHMKRLLTI